MEIKIHSLDGSKVGLLKLDASVWDSNVNRRLLVQAVAMYRSNIRAGLASTKRRGEVSGGGKKPWKQKHTGRARAGSIRSPIWRGGGSVFGPKPRDFSYRLPQQIRRGALRESLKGKLQDDQVVVFDTLEAKTPKTKPFGQIAKIFGVTRASVIVVDGASDALKRSLRNLAHLTLRNAGNLTAFDILNANKLLMTQAALKCLTQRATGSSDAASN